MKPASLLFFFGLSMVVAITSWWMIDSVRYGSPVIYSREAKQIIIKEVDPVFGTEVTSTKYEPGPFLGLLDAAFPFGAFPISVIGAFFMVMSRVPSIRRRRTLRFSTALMVVLMASTTMQAATALRGVSPGKRTVQLNDAVRKNEVRFESNAPLEKIIGSAGSIKGSFKVDPQALEETTGSFIVDVRSMRTGMAKRDDHMMGSDWLDAENYAEIKYTVDGLKNVKIVSTSQGKTTIEAIAVGTFTMHGVSRALEANVTLTYVTSNSETQKRAAGDLVMIEASFSVPWQQYGVKGRKSFNDKVSSNIEVDVSLYGNTGA